MEQRVYARKNLRIRPEQPLYGSVSVVRIGVKFVNSGEARVRIPDISPGGLRFLSRLKIPVDPSVVLEITLRIDDLRYSIQGRIVHRCCSEEGEFEYGFQFLEPNLCLREALKKSFCKIIGTKSKNTIILRLE